jgi:hypothetical protein
MVPMRADGDVRYASPFDRDVLSMAMAMLERYGERALQRARARVAWLGRPSDARARALWTHVVVAIVFLEASAGWRRPARQ